jgi:acyl dehydratase
MNLEIGDRAQLSKQVTEADIQLFAEVTGDDNPIHLDPHFAAATRFKGVIAHGLLSAGLISAVLGTKLPGPGGIYLSQTLQFKRPVRIGDTITAEVVVTRLNPEKHIVTLDTVCRNQDEEDVLTGEAVLLAEPPQG